MSGTVHSISTKTTLNPRKIIIRALHSGLRVLAASMTPGTNQKTNIREERTTPNSNRLC